MKESYGEGLATRTGPESCVAAREGGREALTGERAGRVFSRERNHSGTPTPWRKAEGHIRRVAIARRVGVPRGQRPRACPDTPRARTGRALGRPWRMAPRAASGSPRTHADDARPRAVGQPRSTDEVSEQSRGHRRRRGWREGAWPKGTRASKTRPGRRTGTARAVRWSGYGKSLSGTRRCGSRRSCTTSTTSSTCGRPTTR